MGTLIFLASVLGLMALLVTFVYALIQRSYGRAGRVVVAAGAVVGGYLLVLILVSLTSAATVLPQGQDRCFDEMCFAALRTVAAPTAGAQTVYTVTIQLHNAAQRTAQKPDSPAVSLMDQSDHSYPPTATGAAAFGQLTGQRLAPGQAAVADVQFGLPSAVTRPLLLITEGGGPSILVIGDENSPLHKKTLIQLDTGP